MGDKKENRTGLIAEQQQMIGLKLETPLEKCTHAVGARAALWLQKSHVLHAPGTSCGKNGALEELCGARVNFKYTMPRKGGGNGEQG